MAKRREARKYTDAFRRKVLKDALRLGSYSAAAKKHDLAGSLLTTWAAKFPDIPKPPSKERMTPKPEPKEPRAFKEAIDLKGVQLLLIQAERDVYARIKQGHKMTKTDNLVIMALNELRG